MAVTWDHETGLVSIYADGNFNKAKLYPRSSTFAQPTGWRYQIGKDGHWDGHQFTGSVMDLYVFGTALSLDQINKLRGESIFVIIQVRVVLKRTVFGDCRLDNLRQP